MSFKVDWNLLETDSMSEWTKELLTETLNSGKRPNILASNIEIKDLNFGKIPPTFEILEIGELEKDRFRGIFKLNYDGDAHITLHTKVQANPLKIYSDNLVELENYINGTNCDSNFITPDFLLSNDQFSLPLDLKLSDIKISGIGIIVFSKTKGLTLVFRNDPLDSIKVSSTFDMVQVLANFLQKQIESQIRELFRETLPTVLHKLSLKYITSNTEDFFNNLNFDDLTMNSHYDDLNLFDLNNGIDHYSAKNLQKNLKLFNSRETLNLHIPKFKNLIQRSNLQKFNKKLSPNLLTSLSLMDDNEQTRFVDNNSTNGIPINVLMNKDYNDVQTILKNISNIQSNNYYQKNTNNLSKPKRRTIKLGKKSKARAESMSSNESNSTVINDVEEKTPFGSPQLNEFHSPASTVFDKDETKDSENTLINESKVVHPKPIRLGDLKPIHSHSHFHRNFYNGSPNNSNSSLLSGVGIGNNYFNFTNKDYVDFEEDAGESRETRERMDTKEGAEMKTKEGVEMKIREGVEPTKELRDERKTTETKVSEPMGSESSGLKEPIHTPVPVPTHTEAKSINYMDLKSIKEKLNELRNLEMQNHKHFYMDLPPPYHM